MEFKSLPDVASQTSSPNTSAQAAAAYSGLAWVGMEKIQLPIQWQGQILSGEIKAQVNLKAGQSRGIHMSRLYSILSENLSTRAFGWETLDSLAQQFIDSQGEISNAAQLAVKFQLPLQRKALKSELKGWRLYPVEMEVVRGLGAKAHAKKMTVEILYSSTCPASTALSRELWKQDMKAHFAEENFTHANLDRWLENHSGMPGTPHAQRSKAEVTVWVTDSDFSPQNLIDGLEEVLQTPVQTLVKRVDEQEFARINGQNTMFCEDAARRVQTWLESLQQIQGFKGVFEHQESLHPHNAVSVILGGAALS